MGGEQGLQILQVLLQRGLVQQQGKLVADGGEPVIEQGEVALALAQTPALVAKGQLDPVGGQGTGFELATVQQPEICLLYTSRCV